MITELRKDIWSPDFDSYWRCITTNGVVAANGEAVMGAGVALEAATQYPWLKKRLGEALRKQLCVQLVPEARLIIFPVKHDWRQKASLTLIGQSCEALRKVIDGTGMKIVLPRPGCGIRTGQLKWEDVKPLIKEELGGLKNEIVVVWR